MTSLYKAIQEDGMVGSQTKDMPYHITLGSISVDQEDKLVKLLEHIASKNKAFEMNLSHIGLFGMKVLFLGPDVNEPLLELHSEVGRGLGEGEGHWSAHVTLLIDEAAIIQRAIPIVTNKFKVHSGSITALDVYECFTTRHIASFQLQ